MVYKLCCGQCGLYCYVESSFVQTNWICPNCGGSNTTSLPTDVNGNLITDPLLCSSLIATDPSQVSGTIIQGTDASQ